MKATTKYDRCVREKQTPSDQINFFSKPRKIEKHQSISKNINMVSILRDFYVYIHQNVWRRRCCMYECIPHNVNGRFLHAYNESTLFEKTAMRENG